MVRKISEAKWPSDLAKLDIAIHTGLQKSSRYSLTWDMVDFRSRMLNIPRTKNEEPEHVPLTDVVMAALELVHGRGDARGLFFSRRRPPNPSKTDANGSTMR